MVGINTEDTGDWTVSPVGGSVISNTVVFGVGVATITPTVGSVTGGVATARTSSSTCKVSSPTVTAPVFAVSVGVMRDYIWGRASKRVLPATVSTALKAAAAATPSSVIV